MTNPNDEMVFKDADIDHENIQLNPDAPYHMPSDSNLPLDNPPYGNARDPSPNQQSVAGEDDEDEEDLEEIVPDEMDYTHEDSFRYLEMQRQRDE